MSLVLDDFEVRKMLGFCGVPELTSTALNFLLERGHEHILSQIL